MLTLTGLRPSFLLAQPRLSPGKRKTGCLRNRLGRLLRATRGVSNVDPGPSQGNDTINMPSAVSQQGSSLGGLSALAYAAQHTGSLGGSIVQGVPAISAEHAGTSQSGSAWAYAQITAETASADSAAAASAAAAAAASAAVAVSGAGPVTRARPAGPLGGSLRRAPTGSEHDTVRVTRTVSTGSASSFPAVAASAAAAAASAVSMQSTYVAASGTIARPTYYCSCFGSIYAGRAYFSKAVP